MFRHVMESMSNTSNMFQLGVVSFEYFTRFFKVGHSSRFKNFNLIFI
uniref:Uncharacterized protein n=1 Tax=Lepeophtheirus salmonis TaxID=72036 RepID=A0A0K2V3Z6_LEPSM